MKAKTTKQALLLSVLSLFLCVAMLAGSTFAWFTDTVKSANNIIKSGNLDVELDYYDAVAKDWVTVQNASKIFDDAALWEPGYTEVIYLRLTNEGSLALKYHLGVNIAEEDEGTNMEGETFKLSDYIYFDVFEGVNGELAPFKTREDAMKETTQTTKISTGYSKSAALEKNAAPVYLAMVVYMPTTVGNAANHNGLDDAWIKLGVELFATQYTVEEDSFNNQFDAGAPWTGIVDTAWYFEDPTATEFTLTSAEQLAGLAALVNGTATPPVMTLATSATEFVQDSFKGKTIYLDADINLNNTLWTPIGTNEHPLLANFDGQGHTVSNLKVANDGWAGLIGHAGKGNAITIKDVNIVNVHITSNRMAGSLVGQLYGNIDNCHVTDATITVVPNASGNTYDNGDKVGGIVGWLGDNNNNHSLTNCSANGVTVKAYRDVGGIAGYVAWSTTIANNTVTKAKVSVDQITNYYGDKDFNAGAIWGRNSVSGSGVGVNASENEFCEETVVTSKYKKDGIVYVEDGISNEVIFNSVPADYEGTTVNIAEGTTTIGGYAFASNSNIEMIVLPSTVTTLNDRAFRDTSASTVVLNEGLENISYQAFRNALNVTEVVIPSTVTTISKEAFQSSGVKELVVPANVTTLEYGALRDMKELVSVVIEGNVDIPIYAFRACTKLRTVILMGSDVNFGAGSRGMIFTNKENGDGSAITVYVANETVKDRLLAADTAAKDYGGYKIVVGALTELADGFFHDGADKYYVTNANGLQAFAAEVNKYSNYEYPFKDQTVILTNNVDLGGMEWTPIGDYRFSANRFCGTFDGQGNTISNFKITKKTDKNDSNKSSYGFFGNLEGTVKNLTIDGATINAPVKFVGVLVGRFSEGLIDNCHVTNSSVSVTDWTVGGIVGQWNAGDIKNSSIVNSTVAGAAGVGGIAGLRLNPGETTMENCTVSKCMITDRSPYSGSWADMYGAILGAVYSGEATVYFNDCTVDETTVKGVASAKLYGSLEEGDVVYVNSSIAVHSAAELEAVVGSAASHISVLLMNDIVGTAVLDQTPGVNVVIDGNGHKYDGQIKIHGDSEYRSETLLIKNINFETATADTDFIWSADTANGSFWRYAHNVTIQDCTFTATGSAVHTAVGIRFQQAYNISVIGCTGTNLHSLLQTESCASTVTVDRCTVKNGKNGVSFNNTMNAVIKNTTIESVADGGYGIRHKGQEKDYSLTIENCTVHAFIPVLIRNMTAPAYTATLKGTNELTATNDYGYEIVLSAGDWDNDAAKPSAPTGAYTLTGADDFEVFEG